MQSLVDLARQGRFDSEEVQIWDLFFEHRKAKKDAIIEGEVNLREYEWVQVALAS